ncbi:HTH-type transcriptional regulator/antitoxin HipB [Agromyces terreus]|uniref:HTH-type transcriptional regulator/antitoxin HipB n=1 Tax=Agromyces terreus TaxID=424795 RepID=A0A9X2H3G4_9MICO|nr:helix-turn-helix transcriptional regulator [Agromyces terreus]MCP2369379.1 HTH-type transcriptional regulator/antitoxin HipB [Agromyces terreus]
MPADGLDADSGPSGPSGYSGYSGHAGTAGSSEWSGMQSESGSARGDDGRGDGASSGLDAAGLILRVRRSRDLSQRQLAVAIGIAQSQVARLESGGRRLDVDLLERILAVGGMRIAVLDERGAEVSPVPAEVIRDNAGRRYPAHLDPRVPRSPWIEDHLTGRHRVPSAPARYHHRAIRDGHRRAAGIDAVRGGTPHLRDHPTSHEVQRAIVERRESARARALGRHESLLDPACDCPPGCWEASSCAPGCPCRCET